MSESPAENVKPDVVEKKHLRFLDKLRDSGVTNMFGAAPYLERKFRSLSQAQARDILLYWMHTYSDRHPQEDK